MIWMLAVKMPVLSVLATLIVGLPLHPMRRPGFPRGNAPREGDDMTPKRTGLVLALVTLLTLTAAPAGAQDYPPEAATCAVSVTTPVPGQSISISCGGWMPNGPVEIDLLSQHVHLGTVQANGNGELDTTVTIPSDLAPGDHTLRLSGTNAQGQEQVVEVALTVQEPGEQRGGLAATGMDSGLGVLLGVGLLGAGAAAVYGARRRQANLGA